MVRGKKVPVKVFIVEGMTGKFTEGRWTIFLFLVIDPIRRPHAHHNMINVRVGFAELKETADVRANIIGTIIGVPIVG